MIEDVLTFILKYGGTAGGSAVICYAIARWLKKQTISITIGSRNNGNGKVDKATMHWLSGDALSKHCLNMHQPIWDEVNKKHDTIMNKLSDIGEMVARVDERTKR